jgi:hypothetical protein
LGLAFGIAEDRSVVIKKVVAHPVWSSVIAGAILAALGAVGTHLAGWWPSVQVWLVSAAQRGWHFLTTSHALPGWILVLLGAAAAFGLYVLVEVLRPRTAKPDWRDYRQDTIFDMVWRWGYAGDRISNLCSFCPRCDTQVYLRGDHPSDFHPHRTVFHCDHCDTRITVNGGYIDVGDKVAREIQRRLRSGEWRAAVTPGRQ